MLGLEQAGFRTLVANEIHAHPCQTLRRNFPDVPVVEGSIQELTGADLLAAAGLDGADRPEIDLVAGGPPCQGFSTAGLKDPADPRNSLVGDFIRIVSDLRPRAFLLENVTGLLTLKRGRLFKNIETELDDLGYKFHHSVVFAADHGVPQMRKRLIVLGAREDAPPLHPEASHRDPTAEPSLLDADLPPYVTCGDALWDLPLIESGEIATTYDREPASPYQRMMRTGSTEVFNHQASRHRPEIMETYALVPPGGNWMSLPPERRGGKQGVQRWPVDGLARTVTTAPEDFLHPTLHRIPTIRELARIQSFPDRFEFLGQRTAGNKMRRLGYCSQSQQVGNAVPPLLAEAVGRSVISAFK
jgi:DNA (cytosine-5)-methyltransferase 1